MNKTPQEVALDLKEFFDKPFGGKQNGRYKITKVAFRKLCERKRVPPSFIKDVIDEAYEIDIAVIELGDDFAVNEAKKLRGQRRLPVAILNEMVSGEEEDSEDDE